MFRNALTEISRRLQEWRAGTPQAAEVHQVRGFRVVVDNSRPDIATRDVLARLDEALELIERVQPWRFRHMQRDVREFRVMRYPCRGAYFFEGRAVLTELTFLARRDITAAPVAASIVHEGMHARMHVMGVRHTENRSARIERACRRAELDLGRALPPALGGPVVDRALATLTMDDRDVAPTIDWDVALRRQAAVDRRDTAG